jgi:class 3 adenylate cyclase
MKKLDTNKLIDLYRNLNLETKFKLKYFLYLSAFVILVVFVHTLIAIIYGNSWMESFISSVVAFGIINLLLADRIFKPVEEYIRSGKDVKALKTAVSKLNYNSTLAFLGSSAVYILLRLFMIFSAQDLSSSDKYNIFFAFVNRYVVLAAFVTYVIVSYFTVELKKYFYEKEGLIFHAKSERLMVKMAIAFAILLISPLIDIYYILYYSGKWHLFVRLFTDKDTSLVSTLLILLLAVIISAVIFSKEIYRGFKELASSFEKVRNGDYGYQAVVLTNDEFGVLADDFNQMSKGLEEREFIRDTFGKYIAPEIAAEVIGKRVNLSGELRNTTILFTDIADYTSISEKMTPEELVKMLNEYFSFMIGIIQTNKGVVNKFIGDSVMAVFNAPVKDEEHADNALKAAVEIIKGSDDVKFNGITIRTRIGINTDEVLVGNIGASDRHEYTVIGDGVNLASRLEQLNKNYGSNIMIGERTKELLRAEYKLDKITGVQIKGKKEDQTVYKVNF